MATLFLALRYLRSHRIVYWSIAATAIGICFVIIITSVMGGFSRDMRARIRGLQSDLMVQGAADGLFLKDYESLAAEIGKIPGVRGCAPRIEVNGWLRLSSNRIFSAGREKTSLFTFIGIDPAREAGISRLPEFFANRKKRFTFDFDDGRPLDATGVVVGRQMVGPDGMDDSRVLDWEVALDSVRDDGHPRYCQRKGRIVGTFRSGMAEYDATYVFLPLGEAQKWLGLEATDERPAVVNRIGVAADGTRPLDEIRASILDRVHARRACRTPERHAAGTCGVTRVETWEESRHVLLQAVAVEKALMFFILFLVIVLAGFNIVSIYTLMVKAKTRDIGVVRALGATEADVRRTFIICGVLCGLVGAAIGVAGGLAVSLNLNAVETGLRIWSRELAPMKAAAALTGGLALAALGALLTWWWGINDAWRSSKWISAGIASLLLGVSAAAGFHWTGAYRPLEHDPSLPSTLRVGLVVLCAALPLLATLFRQLASQGEGLFGSAFLHGLALLGGSFATFTAVSLGGMAVIALAAPRYWAGLQAFDRSIFYMDAIPVDIGGLRIALIVAGTLLVCFLFSLHPASRAAAMTPVVALRDE